jgi:tRNA uridine 5-carboxymethylaminomethyl modification enzyme
MTIDGYDVIVVGGGHAGCEAALAAARTGSKTVLVTTSRNAIACMPCNPSVGGIGKSHLVCELDALGGEMARNADYSGIQFRTLNTRRGAAVQATRVQCDKSVYAARMLHVIDATAGLIVIEGMATGILVQNGYLKGVCLADSTKINGKTVVLALGTSVGGRLFIGNKTADGAGNGEAPADAIARSLSDIGIAMMRFKTGTPPRLAKASINYEALQRQDGETLAPFLSSSARMDRRMFHVEHAHDDKKLAELFHVDQTVHEMRPWAPGSDQMPCYLTHTNQVTHKIIADNLHRSSLYGGMIKATGVRYCPSVEDKIVKFPDKSQHHVFIEPEGRNADTVYPNGISNSLPEDVQVELVHSIPGLEASTIIRHAYAIEYNVCDPTQLRPTLESKLLDNLFMAGQINGTTGYEEAAAQGFIAGVNASRRARGLVEITISRQEAYLGVLIDDLVTKGTNEPYRMFTSMAERRLILRQDNVRFRLSDKARLIGIISPDYMLETDDFARMIESETNRLSNTYHQGSSLLQLLRRPGVSYGSLPMVNRSLPEDVATQVEIGAKYEGYIRQENLRAEKAEKLDSVVIPASVDYWKIGSLRRETQEKLSRIRPSSIGQAARVPGITPADIMIIATVVEMNEFTR